MISVAVLQGNSVGRPKPLQQTEYVHQPDQVKVSWARLFNFRCHHHFEMATDASSVVLHGANGTGKTSVLEGFSLFTSSKGLRHGTGDEMRRRGGETDAAGWSVAATLRNGLDVIEARIGWSVNGGAEGQQRKQISVDGKSVGSYAELTKLFQFVWVTPEMDRVLAESAAKRRRLLDRLVCAFDPAHVTRVNAYERSLQQRARLLKEPTWDSQWLAALEDRMVANGIAICVARHETAERLQQSAHDSRHAFPEFFVRFEGEVDRWVADNPALEAEDRYRAALIEARRRDGEFGGAAVGPHRSTFYVHLASSGRRAEDCSMGEQKALVVSFVLASVRLLRLQRRSAPILLLDDVAAHLDRERRDSLFDAVGNLRVQAWYTGTDVSVFDPLRGSAEYRLLG